MPYQPRVVIHFSESVHIPHGEGAETYLSEHLPHVWLPVMHAFPWIRLHPEFITFRTRKELPDVTGPIHAIPRGIGIHVLPAPSPRLARVFFVIAPDEDAARALVATLRSEPLHGLVKRAQVRPRRAPPPKTVNPSDDTAARYQSFQKSAPRGIGARDVWNRSGSSGTGVRVVDVESGWYLEHDQLPHTIPLVSGVNADELNHGVWVLGVLAANDDDAGVVGLCPNATIAVASIVRRVGDLDNVDYAAAIEDAVATMDAGDILLLELQTNDAEGSRDQLPIETLVDVFLAIQAATDKGIIVIEAAGNSGRDLDVVTTDLGYSLKRNESEDSGAIMVGGCRHTSRNRKHWWDTTSNYGSRIDCYAWGEGVVTLGQPPNKLQMLFNGTSAASAIIAGAAAIVQGIVRDRYENDPTLPAYLKPSEMRALFAATGTPSEDAAQYPIGLMPDLAAIVQGIA